MPRLLRFRMARVCARGVAVACAGLLIAWVPTTHAQERTTIPPGGQGDVPIGESNVLSPGSEGCTSQPGTYVTIVPSGTLDVLTPLDGFTFVPGSRMTVRVRPDVAPGVVIGISWATADDKCYSANGIVYVEVGQPAASGPVKQPKQSEACVRQQVAANFAKDAETATVWLAGAAAVMVGAELVLPPSVQERLLKDLLRALPPWSELVDDVQSHSSRPREEGAWVKPRGNDAQKAADVQRQVSEVFNSPDRKIQYFGGTRERIDVYLPPSAKYPKGKAIRFFKEGAKWVLESLGTANVVKNARIIESAALAPLSAATLLAAGMTATASISSAAVAGVNKYLCSQKSKKPGAQAVAALRLLGTARPVDTLVDNLERQARFGRGLHRAVAQLEQARGKRRRALRARAGALARRLAGLVAAEPRLRDKIARTPSWRAPIVVPASAIGAGEEQAVVRRMTPLLRRFGAPKAAAQLAVQGLRRMLAEGRRFTLGELLRDRALTQHDRNTARALRLFARRVSGR